MSEPELSVRELVSRGRDARDGRRITNNCWDINTDIREGIWGWTEENGIAAPPESYPSEYADVVRFTVTDREQSARHEEHYAVVVDAALDQFNHTNHQHDAVPVSLGPEKRLADVVVAPPNDEFRVGVYHRQSRVQPDADVSVELPL